MLESDRLLIEAARHDPQAFGELYERYVDVIFSFVWRRLGDQIAAEDVTAETFQHALENIHRYEWRGVPFSHWLYRIASNAIAARFRHPGTVEYVDTLDNGEGSPEPEEQVLARERIAEMLGAVRLLPSDQQQVIVLRFGQGLRAKEIAGIMDRTEGAVKALLHRAIGALQRHLDERHTSTAGGIKTSSTQRSVRR